MEPLSNFRSLIESYMSDIFDQSYNRIRYSQDGQNIYLVSENGINQFQLLFTSQSQFSSKIKTMAAKKNFEFKNIIRQIDVDAQNQQFAIQEEQNLKQLSFYEIEAQEQQGSVYKLMKRGQQLSFQDDINDFYFTKTKIDLCQKQYFFLLVWTKSEYLILLKQDNNFQCVATLEGIFMGRLETTFQFYTYYQGISGIVCTIVGQKLTLQIVEGICGGKQSNVTRRENVFLRNVNYDSIVGVIKQSGGHFKIIFQANNQMIALYKAKMNEQSAQLILRKSKLIQKQLYYSAIMYNKTLRKTFAHYQIMSNQEELIKSYIGGKYKLEHINKTSIEKLENCFWILYANDQLLSVDLKYDKIEQYVIKNGGLESFNSSKANFKNMTNGESIEYVKFSQSRKDRIVIALSCKSHLYLYEAQLDVQNFELRYLYQFTKHGLFEEGNQRDIFQLIYMKVPRQVYRLIVMASSTSIIASDVDIMTAQNVQILKLSLQNKIELMYVCKAYPYYIVILDNQEQLLFYTIQLTKYAQYDLRQLKYKGAQKPLQYKYFNIKHLYDQKFIMFVSERIYIGKIVPDINKQSFQFKIIEFQGYYLKNTDYQEGPEYSQRDKIITFNERYINIRNCGKIIFGSLVLQPQKKEKSSAVRERLNIHKYIFLRSYQFEFFTLDTFFYLLKIRKPHVLYQNLIDLLLEYLLQRELTAEDVENRNHILGSVMQSENYDILAAKFEQEKSFSAQKGNQTKLRDSILDDSFNESKIPSQKTIGNNNKRFNFSVNFDPSRIEVIIRNSFQQFLSFNKIENEYQLQNILIFLYNQLQDDNSTKKFKSKLADVNKILDNLQSNSGNFDQPSFFVYTNILQNQYNGREEGTLSSEIVFNSCLTEHKQFIVKKLKCEECESWDELKWKCLIYWIDDMSVVREIIESFLQREYQKNRDPWNMLFWYIIFGKAKILSGLFKFQRGQEKLVNFFLLDFDFQKNRKTAINNAYVLRSKQRYFHAAAIFILAKSFSEAFDIIFNILQDFQMGILVYRIFKNEIEGHEESRFFFHRAMEQMIEDSKNFNDVFLEAIYYYVMDDYGKMSKLLTNIVFEGERCFGHSVDDLCQRYNFKPIQYSFTKSDLLCYIKQSSKYKRYFQSTIGSAQNQSDIKIENNDNIMLKNGNLFLQQAPVQKKIDNFILLDDDEDEDENQEGEEEDEREKKQTKADRGNYSSEYTNEKDKQENNFTIEQHEIIKRFELQSENQNYYLALIETILLKKNNLTIHGIMCVQYRKRIKYIIQQISHKKISRMMLHQSYEKSEVIVEAISSLCRYFGISTKAILKILLKRAQLIDDQSLIVYLKSLLEDESKVSDHLSLYLNNVKKECKRRMEKGKQIFKGSKFTEQSLEYILEVRQNINNIARIQLEEGKVVPLLGSLVQQFNEIINDFLKIVFIKARLFVKAVELIQFKLDIPITCDEFNDMVCSALESIYDCPIYTMKQHFYQNTQQSENQGNIIDQSVKEQDLREIFIQTTTKGIDTPINKVITQNGLNKYNYPNNIMLLMIVEIAYMKYIIDAKMQQNGNIKRHWYNFRKRLRELYQGFLIISENYSAAEIGDITEEIVYIFQSRMKQIKGFSFLHVDPIDSLDLAHNKSLFNVTMNMERHIKFLRSVKKLRQIEEPLEQRVIFNIKQNLFEKYTQIYRPKIEVNAFFKKKSIKALFNFNIGNKEELLICIHNNLKRVYLFDTLYKKPRQDDYYKLQFQEDMNSQQNYFEDNCFIQPTELTKKPIVFLLYYLHFAFKGINRSSILSKIFSNTFSSTSISSQSNMGESYLGLNHELRQKKIIDLLVERKPHINKIFKEIQIVSKHPFLDLVAISEGCMIYIHQIKTLTSITSISVPTNKSLRNIIFDEDSFKLLVIDKCYCSYLYNYDITFTNIKLVKIFNKIKIYDGNFVKNSSTIIMSPSSSNDLLFYNIITNKQKIIHSGDQFFERTKIITFPDLSKIVFINRKNGSILFLNQLDMGQKIIVKEDTQINCYNQYKNYILIGLQNNMLKIYNIINQKILCEQKMDIQEGKQFILENICVCDGFVFCGFSNGSVYIVNKI